MRKLFTLCLLVFSLSASAQWQQTGSKVRYVNGLGIPTRDTAAGVAADSSQILIRPADSALYVKYKRTWLRVGGGTVSGTTNRVSKFTGATTVGNSSIVDSASAVAMTITPAGNIGIGTASPAYKLDVRNDVPASTSLEPITSGLHNNNDGGSSIYFRNSVNGQAKIAIGVESTGAGTDDTYLGFNTSLNASLSEKLRITSSGNLGIGYTAPAAKLSVSGTTLINTNTDNGVDKLQVSGNTLSTRYKVNTSGQTLEINNYYNTGSGNNIWIGNGGASSTSGYNNVAIGGNALLSVTSGFLNTAVGASALQSLTSGSGNMAFGFESLPLLTTGTANTAIGPNALGSSTTGSDNTGIGNASLIFLTTTSSNVGIGRDAGRSISGGSNLTTPTQSVFIGNDTRASANGNTNEVVIGHANIGQGSNTVTLGNSSITKTFLRGSVMVNTTTDNGVDKLQVSGSIQGTGFDQAYLARTTAYTATDTDYLIDCTTGTFTVTLPASSGRTGRILIIKNSGTGTITVDGNAAETIDGAATYSLSVQYATVQIMSDGTNWKIISKF